MGGEQRKESFPFSKWVIFAQVVWEAHECGIVSDIGEKRFWQERVFVSIAQRNPIALVIVRLSLLVNTAANVIPHPFAIKLRRVVNDKQKLNG